MSSDSQPPPAGPPGNRGRRWPGPTIDLDATEIASTPVTPKRGTASIPPEEPAMTKQNPAGRGPVRPEPSTMTQLRDAIADGLASLLARLPPDPPWRKIGAAAGGVAVVVVLFLVAGLFRSGDSGSPSVEARLARAEQQLRELSGRAPTPTVIPKIVDDLGSRIDKLEARPPVTEPGLLNRIARLEGAYNARDEIVGSVARQSDDVGAVARDAGQKADAAAAALAELRQRVAQLGTTGAGQGDLEALASRTAALERAIKVLEAELLKRSTSEANNRSVRLAVTATALNAAVERGDGFAGELAAAKALAADVRVLAPLEPFAATGLPSAASLGRELLALMPALRQLADTQPRQGGVFDRLQANAERLVRIRPIDEVPGDDLAAVLARIEFRATQSDIPGVLTEFAKLPTPASAQAWIAKAQARITAIAASRQFAAQAFAALGKTP